MPRIAAKNIAAVDLNLLLAFEAMLEERNVTRAGRRIGLAQPSMSSALARLRALFDDGLFRRDAGTMAPTPTSRHGKQRLHGERPAPQAVRNRRPAGGGAGRGGAIGEVSGTIRLFSPDAELPALRASRTASLHRLAKHGEVPRFALDVLLVRAVHKRVGSALRDMERRGVLRSETRDDGLPRWSVA